MKNLLNKRILVTGGAGFEDITVFGKGNHTRSFCYVDDLIDGLIKLMNSPDDFTGPLNLGNPNEFSILELAEKVIELTGTRSKIVFKPLPADDPLQRQPDTTLAQEMLNWRPSINLEKGLIKTIEYFSSV
jgi:UDP-glucuronate decarboxylase